MSIPAAYLGVIIIWSTTPLAIKWSGEGGGFLFGVSARMVLGAGLCLLLLGLLRKPLPLNRHSLQVYLAGAVAGYGSMLMVYWGASYIPSGWVSVIFGLTPIITALLAMLLLRNESISPYRLLGMTLALFGLWRIFAAEHVQAGDRLEVGIGLVLLAVFLHSLSAVWLQALNSRGEPLPALSTTTGTLLLIVPLYLVTMLLNGFDWPGAMPARSVASIVYLGVIGSVVGFMLYFYVLQHVSATQTGLITVITPVTALGLGALLNGESLGLELLWGAGLILLGLSLFQWGHRLRRLL